VKSVIAEIILSKQMMMSAEIRSRP